MPIEAGEGSSLGLDQWRTWPLPVSLVVAEASCNGPGKASASDEDGVGMGITQAHTVGAAIDRRPGRRHLLAFDEDAVADIVGNGALSAHPQSGSPCCVIPVAAEI